jgi:hypothetical protein
MDLLRKDRIKNLNSWHKNSMDHESPSEFLYFFGKDVKVQTGSF